jgi:hypothetical protein
MPSKALGNSFFANGLGISVFFSQIWLNLLILGKKFCPIKKALSWKCKI